MGGIGSSVLQTQTQAPGVPISAIALSLESRSFGSIKALTKCSGTGAGPASSNKAFGKAAALRAS